MNNIIQLKRKKDYSKQELGNMVVFLKHHIGEAERLGSIILADRLKKELDKLGYKRKGNFVWCPFCETRNHCTKKECMKCRCRLK